VTTLVAAGSAHCRQAAREKEEGPFGLPPLTERRQAVNEAIRCGQRAGADAAKTQFGKLDKNHDGKLSKDEFSSGSREKKKRRKKKEV
jgi:hypothetical protein